VKLLQHDWKESGIKNVGAAMLHLENYKYSSFADYDGKRRIEETILNREVFPGYFKTQDEFRREILAWITFNPKSIATV
jgi:hypothetical protein